MIISLQQVQVQHGPVAIRQLHDRFFNRFHLVTDRLFIVGKIFGTVVSRYLLHIHPIDLSFIKHVDGTVDADLLQPTTETGPVLEGSQVAECFCKAFLQHILRFGHIIQQSQTGVEHRPGVALVQLLIGQGISLQAALYELIPLCFYG